jgi:multidrug efflux pump subunit AcrB
MNFSAWAIKNPIPSIMLFVLLTLAGTFSFKAMKIQQFPDIDLPIITVRTTLPGAAPNQLETEVARKIEDSIATISGIKNISTRVYDGNAVVTAEFRLEKPVQEALDDVRSSVSSIRGDLPTTIDDPIIQKVNLASSPVLAYAIASPNMDAQQLTWFVENDIAKLLLSVRGVGAINSVGGVKREIEVALDPIKLQALNATAADVSRQLAAVQIEVAGGKTEIGGTTQPLRTQSRLDSAQALADIEISLSDGRNIRLNQLATITDTYAKRSAAAFLDGRPVIGFEVVKSKGASDVEVGKGVRAQLSTLKATHPEMQINESFDFVTPVEDDFNASMIMLYEGALLAVLVVWLFLRDLRATLISAVALPLSLIPAFIGMYLMGFTINVVTLLALSLVVGVLVDDAIVEVENIVRHMQMGKTPYQAAMEAADEIGLAVIATTFTLISVFLPTAFMSGIVGKFFLQFGWTAAYAIFASLVVARLLTPMMAAYLLKPIIDRQALPTWADRPLVRNTWRWMHSHPQDPAWLLIYMKIEHWCLLNRWKAIFGVFGVLFLLIFASQPLPSAFIPAEDNSQTQVYIELSPGSPLEETTETAERIRQLLITLPAVKTVYTTIASGSAGSDPFAPPGIAETRNAALTIQLAPRHQRPKKQIIERDIRALVSQVPGIRAKVGLGGSGEKYQLALTGSDPELLTRTALLLEKDIRTINGVGNIESSASLVRSEISVKPHLAKAAEMGVTSTDIADTLRIATVGDFNSRLAKLNLPQRQIPIVVKLARESLTQLETLSRLAVPGNKGAVMLGQVAQLSFGSGPSVIERFNRERNVTFNVELAGIPLGEMEKIMQTLPTVKNLPPSLRLQEVGDAEANAEMEEGFATAMLTGVLCIYIVLVLLFKTFLHPMTILFALPLSIGGALMGLKWSGLALSMPSLIGLLMLMGVCTKNSILLVDYAIESRRKKALSRIDALLDACHKRARPIVMTSIAMAAGMLPIAAGWGTADTSFRAPMAVSVIGGLVTSTILSLLVIPPIFTVIDDVSLLFARLFGKAPRQ